MNKKMHDNIFRFMIALVFISLIAVVFYTDEMLKGEFGEIRQRRAYRKIDKQLIDSRIRDGKLSNTPARYYKKLESGDK